MAISDQYQKRNLRSQWPSLIGAFLLAAFMILVFSTPNQASYLSGIFLLLFLVVCPLMMFLMMRDMSSQGQDKERGSREKPSIENHIPKGKRD